jgi:phosphoribosyl-ATP pyrophosphohydrolase/phosphoribosyl-AMP cyclohydrolase
MHFWSRSRGELWHKGETSGNVQRVRALRLDCDADALLALVEPQGPACHTGARTCFHRALGAAAVATHEALPALGRTLSERRRDMPEDSYTARLLRAGQDRMGSKVTEEAEEVVRAAGEESDERLTAEAADLLYHLGVVLEARGLSYADALEELTRRMGR